MKKRKIVATEDTEGNYSVLSEYSLGGKQLYVIYKYNQREVYAKKSS